MKKCNLDCEYQHEGCCIGDLCVKGFNPESCTASINDYLMSYDEMQELIEMPSANKKIGDDIGEQMLEYEAIGKIMTDWKKMRDELDKQLDNIGTQLFKICKELYRQKG